MKCKACGNDAKQGEPCQTCGNVTGSKPGPKPKEKHK